MDSLVERNSSKKDKVTRGQRIKHDLLIDDLPSTEDKNIEARWVLHSHPDVFSVPV